MTNRIRVYEVTDLDIAIAKAEQMERRHPEEFRGKGRKIRDEDPDDYADYGEDAAGLL
jgi:hypothetical protein